VPALVQYAVDRAIAIVTLDSPANRNALSAQLVGETTRHLAAAAADDDVRAILLTHSGRVFCAGLDFKEQSSEGGPQAGTARLLGLQRTIVELPKPVIARIDGAVRAGGLGIVGACDLAFASLAASFAFTEVRLGLAPAIISLTTLGRMTERAAARYYLTGETFDSETAATSGLITGAPSELDAELGAVLGALRACSPRGLAETKPLTTRATRAAFDAYATRCGPSRHGCSPRRRHARACSPSCRNALRAGRPDDDARGAQVDTRRHSRLAGVRLVYLAAMLLDEGESGSSGTATRARSLAGRTRWPRSSAIRPALGSGSWRSDC
jgi:enoyl-CoA hydratase